MLPSIWSPYTKQSVSKLEMIQRTATRWVKNSYSPYETVTRMLDDLGWRLLENGRTDAHLIMFHMIIIDYVAIIMKTYLFKYTENFTTKN